MQAQGVTRGPRLGKGEKNRKVFEREAEGNPALRIWKGCAAAGSFHRLGLGWRTSEYEVHIWWYLDGGGCLIKLWSSTQTTIALSSAEAELYAMSRCAQHALSLVSAASDLNIELHPTIHTDASAALNTAYRSGAGGRTRHVKVQYLLVQGAASRKDLRVAKSWNVRESS